jgi:ubiquinone/menaquinone biosynthesis C-methylase UbiE
LFDPVTFRNRDATGIHPGWRCLEVGAGGGSVALWLAERVGPAGHVLATDLDPGWLAPADRPVVEIRRHDITRDPRPAGAL